MMSCAQAAQDLALMGTKVRNRREECLGQKWARPAQELSNMVQILTHRVASEKQMNQDKQLTQLNQVYQVALVVHVYAFLWCLE